MRPDRSHGFSLLELVVVIAIVAILMAVAASKYLTLAVEAERVAMESLVGTLRSALYLKVAELIVQDKVDDMAALEGSNPMNRLAELPSNYLGERDGIDPAGIDGGIWYFDKRERVLVYRVRNEGYFQTELAGPARARFAVRLVFDDRNKNGVYDVRTDKIEGMRLAALEAYRWTN